MLEVVCHAMTPSGERVVIFSAHNFDPEIHPGPMYIDEERSVVCRGDDETLIIYETGEVLEPIPGTEGVFVLVVEE